MRVVLVSGVFAEYTIELANALAKQPDTDVTVILPGRWASRMEATSWKSLLQSNINVMLFRYAEFSPGLYAKLFFLSVQLASFINELNPDIVHIQESGDEVVLAALPFIRKGGIVMTIHDVQTHPGSLNPGRDLRKRLMMKRAKRIIVHGNYLKNMMLERFDLGPDRVCIIPHGEFSIYQRLSPQSISATEEPNSVLFFGAIQPYKGLDYLIKAEPQITSAVPDAKIIIAGGTGKARTFQEYEKLMVHKDKFELHIKFIPHQEVAGLFQRAGVVVLPYTEASQSGVIPIAYAFGKPVVVTRVGSIPEVVDEGGTGLIVPPKDSNALAEAVIRILTDDKMRQAMGRNAYEKTRGQLSWDAIAGKTVAVYRDVLAESKKARKA